MLGLKFSVGDTLPGLQLVLSKTLRIGHTKLLLNIGKSILYFMYALVIHTPY